MNQLLFKSKITFTRRANLLRGSILNNKLSTYWFAETPNFGDLLSPALLKYYGFTPINSSRNHAQVLAIGSILDKVSEDYSGLIIGSGLMYDQPKRFPNAKIIAVRGKLTKERIGAPDSVILGDPGLLADRILRKRQMKTYKLGIVLHFVDQGDKRINKISQRHPKGILIIDVRQNPKNVIRNIDKCEYILSSSLHGLITADSLGIPHGWIKLSEKVLGHGFKFFDYASSINKIIEPNLIDGSESLNELINFTRPVSKDVQMVKDKLHYVFSGLKESMDRWFSRN